MRINLLLTIMVVILTGCATIPQTRVYREGEGTISESLCVLPVQDNTPERAVTQLALNTFHDDLLRSLEESGRFRNVQSSDIPENASAATVLQCRITQCDPSARRMSVVAEIRSGDSNQPFLRLVTHTELVSVAWPIDYIAVMERAAKAVANDLTKSIVRVSEGK